MMKKLFAFLTAALFLVMSLNINALTAEAADPKTYYVKYYPDKKAWYYQPGNVWDEEVAGRELYYMTLEFQDGDYVDISGYAAVTVETTATTWSDVKISVYTADKACLADSGVGGYVQVGSTSYPDHLTLNIPDEAVFCRICISKEPENFNIFMET